MKELLEFASDRQAQAINAYLLHGTYAKAAKAIGCNESSCKNLIKRARDNAAKKGWSPDHDMTKPVPDPYIVKGTSTLYDEAGNKKLQWVKTSVDQDRLLQMVHEVVDTMREEVEPLPPIEFSGHAEKELLNSYILTDAHLGAYGWAEESGADWNLEVAEKTINRAMDGLMMSAPEAHTGFLMQLGDFLHSDGLMPVTPKSGHVLDQDGRYTQLVRTGVRILRRNISALLAKHKSVIVLLGQGNHDLSGSVWLQEMFSALYENNPRVKVIVSPLPFYAIQHGRALIGGYHGHECKPEKLPEVFSAEFRQLMGSTDKTLIHCGHRHEWRLFETPTSIVEQHPTIAARDGYTSSHGYKSSRMMQCITYHTRNLEVKRCTERPYYY